MTAELTLTARWVVKGPLGAITPRWLLFRVRRPLLS